MAGKSQKSTVTVRATRSFADIHQGDVFDVDAESMRAYLDNGYLVKVDSKADPGPDVAGVAPNAGGTTDGTSPGGTSAPTGGTAGA
jgi:hypothetical protein